MAMVITPCFPRCSKKQQGRSNTRVKFRSAQPSHVGKISVGANTTKYRPPKALLAFLQAL
jgi:hypothetical protein